MSYSVCRRGGSMCNGCMACYNRRSRYDDEVIEVNGEDLDDIEEDEEEEES